MNCNSQDIVLLETGSLQGLERFRVETHVCFCRECREHRKQWRGTISRVKAEYDQPKCVPCKKTVRVLRLRAKNVAFGLGTCLLIAMLSFAAVMSYKETWASKNNNRFRQTVYQPEERTMRPMD